MFLLTAVAWSQTDPRVQQLYAEAKAAQARGDQAVAAATYESLIAVAPRLGAAYNNLGLLYFQQREYGKAAAILEKGLRVNRAMSSASALLGMSLFQMGKYQEARSSLESALRANPKDEHVELFLANDLIRLDDFEDAATHLKQIIDRQPENQEAWYLLGNVYMELSKHAFSRLNEIAPDSVFVHETSGEIMESMKNFDGALIEYKKAVEMAPQQAGTHYKLGNAYWSLAQWDAATEQFQAELENDPNNCMAHWKIGSVLIEQHVQPDNALSSLDEALAICPSLVQARVDRARALLTLDRPADALSDLLLAAKVNPEESSIHFLLAQAHRALGHKEQAQAELQLYNSLEESARAATAERTQQVIQNHTESEQGTENQEIPH